jgi:hypothetical protein
LTNSDRLFNVKIEKGDGRKLKARSGRRAGHHSQWSPVMSFVSLSGHVKRINRAALRFDRGIPKTGMVCRFSITPSRHASAPVAFGMAVDR